MRKKILIFLLSITIIVAFLGCLESENLQTSNETEKEFDNRLIVPNMTSGTITNQVFNESIGILTTDWDARNFAGFWRDPETGVSTETMVINQTVLNHSHRVIEKNNLIYTTTPISINYQVYSQTGKALSGTRVSYAAIGWLGEKYVFLQGDRIARIIFEQNASEERTLTVGESWYMGEGYALIVNSIDAKAATPQTWITLTKDGKQISNVVLGPYIEQLYTYQTEQNSDPILIVYFSGFKLDFAAFKYGWLRSQNLTKIKKGDIFGIMEVTYIDNGKIELRNREPIDLAPGKIINLMGDISIQVSGSEGNLEFHPFRVDYAQNYSSLNW